MNKVLRMSRDRAIVLLVIAFWTTVAIFSCAGMPGAPEGAKSFSEMNPKEKSLFLMKTYNKQYDQYLVDYERAVNRGPTDAEKEALRVKYNALNDLYPFINTYMQYADEGVVPPEAVESACITALNKLLGI